MGDQLWSLFILIIMENSIYSNLGNRLNKRFQDKREMEHFTIKDFVDNKFQINSVVELKSLLVKELKELLKKENLFDLVQSFVDLEHNLELASDKLDSQSLLETPINFELFHRNLSPVLMRSILDNLNNKNDEKQIMLSIKESIRIAIEEVIYHLSEL